MQPHRAAEFHGSTRLLCAAGNIPRLAKLERLNLYHCGLNRLTGIGNLEVCPLRELALGRNELKSLPDDVRRVNERGSRRVLVCCIATCMCPLTRAVLGGTRLRSWRS